MASRPPLTLERLPTGTQIIDPETGKATIYFKRWLDRRDEELERAFREQADIITAVAEFVGFVETVQTAADNAQAAADAANAAAEAVRDAADATASANKLANSYTDSPPDPITATDVGGSITVVIADHVRRYVDGTSVTVLGDIINGLDFDTAYVFFYSDPTFQGGEVSYQFSTNDRDAAQVNGIHSVGAVMTPSLLGDPIEGKGPRPPGYVDA